jgi:NAD(P)-dependent dehydrogenase (short-subunit alcohol dehydrogenase family)
VNARGVFLACRAAIDGMRARRSGAIINIASVAGLIAVERRFSYCVSKGAVVELTRALAVDYAAEGIRANAICPGTVDTPMIRGYVARYFSDAQEETIATLHARQPVGRMGRPEEVAALAVYLAGDESAFLTGAALPIDGGWTAK